MSINDWPHFDTNIDLTNRPINYVDLRIKALIKREMDELLKITATSARDKQIEQMYLSPDLGVPHAGTKMGKLSFSEKTFLVGSNVRAVMIQAV